MSGLQYTVRQIKNTILFMMLITLAVSPAFAVHSANKIQHTKKSHAKIIHKKSHSTNKKYPHKKLIPTHAAINPVTPAAKVNTPNISHSLLPGYLLSSIEKNLVHFVRNTIESIRYTTYKLGGTKIDTSKGIYIVDCSTYVDHILKTIYPRAFSSLSTWSGSQKPTTNDYYHYFRNLSDDSEHWNAINDVEELRPGDILVFRNKNRYGTQIGGHVMIVMDKPERKGNIFLLRIADSASSGHSKDTRMPHTSGIGIGSMLLKVHPGTLRPSAYAWRVGSHWETNVSFAMARPVGSFDQV
jgi:cell wall-associated NlpC family hydrolase